MADQRYLGDVPGLTDLLPNAAILPTDYSVYEVNALGEVTADMAGIGDITTSMGRGGDPFAVPVGSMDQPGDGGMGEGGGARDPMQSSYMPTYDSSGGVAPGPVAAGSTSYDDEQLANAKVIAEVGKKVGASERDIQIALMAAIVESGLRNLDYGDRDSIGMFQQRDAWGSREDRLDPAKSAEMFFLGGQGGQRGLLDISDRDKMSAGEAAQAVQVSAFPERYAEHESEAAQIIASLNGKTTKGTYGDDPYGLTTYGGKTVDNLTAAALDAAARDFGKPLSIAQGSHSHEVAASGSTHDGGGVIDIVVGPDEWDAAVESLRKIGFAAWHRTSDQGPWPEHIHAVLIGNEQLSPSAQQQVQSYLNNDNGLTGNALDDGPRQYVNNRFVWGQVARKDGGEPPWRSHVVKLAKTYLGTPFQWGGKDYSGIDNETLVQKVYSELGVKLPRDTFGMAYAADPVPIEEAKPGDLIAWDRHPGTGTGHVGIYIGNGQIVEAGAPGRVVQINDLGEDALNAWGVPMQDLIRHPEKVDPFRQPASPGPTAYVQPPRAPSGAPLQGQASNPYNDTAPAKPPKHYNTPAGTGAANPDKPNWNPWDG